MKQFYVQVMAFMRGAQQKIGSLAKPEMVDVELRVKCIVEEALEFAMACGFFVIANWPAAASTPADGVTFTVSWVREPNLIAALDALCDLLYVIVGTFICWGLNIEPYTDEVHRSNMTKLGPDKVIREDGRVMKPPSYEPPDLARVLDVEIRSAGRRAPLQGDEHDPWKLPASTIPWCESAHAWRAYDLMYGGQSHERLCERGGFGVGEYLSFKALADRLPMPPAADKYRWTRGIYDAEYDRIKKLSAEEVWKLLGPNVVSRERQS